MMVRMQQAHEPSVRVSGPIRNPIVPWTEDLTLAKAIIVADYNKPTNPRQIIILRAGQPIVVDLAKFLAGEDVALQPGDIVDIKP
jgi:hypothetical protein